MKNQTLSIEIRKEIANLYNSGLSCLKLSKTFNKSFATILKYVREFGVIVRPARETALKYEFNEFCFSEIDSPEKAYWLGFIIADGSINSKGNNLKLTLSSKDVNHLEKFKIFLKSNHPIKTYKLSSGYKIGASSSEIRIFSPILIDSLKALHILQNKTFTVKIPKIPTVLNRHLLRGLLDGDGWVSLARSNTPVSLEVGICGNSFVMNWFSGVLTGLNIKHKITPDKSIFRIRITNKRSIKLLEWLYKDASVYMDRKYNNFLEYLALQLNRKEKTLPIGIRMNPNNRYKKFQAFLLATEAGHVKYLGAFATSEEAIFRRQEELNKLKPI